MNTTNPKVTVRMSAYNHEAYVEQAILSIVNQTFQDFELIVIDDGSKDRTPEIIERLSRKHGFYFERQHNMGLVRTLNKITPMARGVYLTGCASDDFWPATRLEEQVAMLDGNSDVALVHGIPAIVDDSGQVIKDARFQLEQMLDGEEAFRDMVWRRKKFQTTTVMIRLSVCRELGGYDENIAVEDVDWMLRVTRKYPVKAVAKIWNYYRKHGENWTMTKAGVRKLIRGEKQVAYKLGLPWGLCFAYARIPIWLLLHRRAASKQRFIYLLLLPICFWNKMFLFNFLAIILGEDITKKIIGSRAVDNY